jgi:hypothetical protein
MTMEKNYAQFLDLNHNKLYRVHDLVRIVCKIDILVVGLLAEASHPRPLLPQMRHSLLDILER